MSLGLLFPGQGSQKVGMLGDLIDAFPIVRHSLKEADDALGFALSKLILEGPEEALGRTENTQPAMLIAGVATSRALEAAVDVSPLCVAGHSLGEYSALVYSGALDFADALRLVRLRGQAMQAAVPEGQGLMAAVLGLDDEAVESVCASVQGIAQAVNYNAPGQVVIAGERAAVLAAIESAKAAGAKRAMPLAVSVPAHSSLMAPASEELAKALAETNLRMPRVPVIQNVDAKVAKDVTELSDKLIRQVAEPVRFVGCVSAMQDMGMRRVIECGPGSVLAGLVRRVDRGVEVLSTGGLGALEKTIEALKA